MREKLIIFAISLFTFLLSLKAVLAFNLNPFSSLLDFLFPASPEIISAKVEPIKVEPSDYMEITVEARDKYGITSVKADMAGIEKVELKLIYGDEKSGIWKATWFVHSVEVGKSYNAKIIVTNKKGKISIANVEFHDDPVFCCRRTVNITGSVWGYRKPITISNSGSALTDYQVLVILDTQSLISAGKMRSDCGDIRFTDSDGVTNLNYWLESGCNTTSTKIWVKVPSIPASSTKTIYVYYGNPSATRADNPQDLDLWQLREHQTDTAYYPAISFSKPTGTVIRIDSYTAGTSSLGEGYVFIVVPKNYLNGKKVQVYWNLYYSYAGDSRDLGLGKVLVLDTELNRKQTLSINSIQNLFTNIEATHYPGPLGAPAGWLGWRTDTSSILNLSTFTSDYVTLMIKLEDGWIAQTVMLDVDWLKILDASNNVLLTFDFPDNVTMEVSNTYEDYGLYRKYTSPEPTTSVGNEETPATVILDTASLISAGKMRSDCGDIRFVDNSTRSFDAALWTANFSYYLSSGCNSASTVFLVNVPQAGIGKTFYVYYGNPAVTSISTSVSTLGYWTTALLPEETWIRIAGGSSSLLITGGGGNLTIK